MAPVVGFDFGTTNSLISLVQGGRAVNFLDAERPIPSVVCYEGAKVLAGREAKERLSKAGLGVHRNVVRSPKMFLGRDAVTVEGVERSPVDMVADIVRHVVKQAGTSTRELKGIDAAVVTIPVNMVGFQRRALRDAFRRANVRIVQFVHEPLAALYGYFRAEDVARALRQYDQKLVLVFDWGGGTLDLTLCRPMGGMVVQVLNDGTDEVGGDVFDEALMAHLIQKVYQERGLGQETAVQPGARERLLNSCERAKIELSTRRSVTIFVNSYFKGLKDDDFQYELSQQELEQIVTPMLEKGFRRIETLLESAGFSSQQVALCLATGGMANMPAVQQRLHEWFGPQRVSIPDSTATLIAEGAAWIASDRAGLQLAKTVEVVMARNSYLPLVKAGTPMPREGENPTRSLDLYCVDPRDGLAKVQLCVPLRPGTSIPSSDPRVALETLTVEVDARARPFTERLAVTVTITDDLILQVDARSTDRGTRSAAEVHSLEFGLAFPVDDGGEPRIPADVVAGSTQAHERGAVTFRANVAATNDGWRLVPGEFAYEVTKNDYNRIELTEIQRREHLYYQLCAKCHRRSSDPACTCDRGARSPSNAWTESRVAPATRPSSVGRATSGKVSPRLQPQQPPDGPMSHQDTPHR